MRNEQFDHLVCVRDILLLRLLRFGDLNGWQIKQQLSSASERVLAMEPAPLYATLSRLEKKGFVVAQSQRDDRNHRVKVYRLTASGQNHLDGEWERWKVFATAVATILEASDLPLAVPGPRMAQVA